MTEMLTGESESPVSKHSAMLVYIADQLRCYSEEMIENDEVLPAFADVLDELAIELETMQENRGSVGHAVTQLIQ